MDLPFHDHWIDQIAKIVNRDKLNDLSCPVSRIDFDLTNMRASRIREITWVVERLFS